MAGKGSSRPSVEFATGQSSVKGEDVLLVRPRVSFPKATAGGRLVASKDRVLCDSASSVHVSANGLQDSLPLEEAAKSHSGSRRSLSRQRQNSLQGTGTGTFGLFCVFDGHNGAHAAQHLEETLLTALEEKLPAGHPPSENDEPAFTRWREELQRALVETFCEVNEAFACKGLLAGATITVVVQYGWLLTVANCGDSRALLDTCNEITQLTVDHRISTHQADRRRLQALGAQIAPIDGSGCGPAVNSVGYGPLRVWPGGLCLSRGIGDFDIGPPVIACPHLYQVRIPETGGRLIVASDGVWDGFENMKRLCRMSRNWSCQAAPNKIIQALQRAFGGLKDDTSMVVLDVTPPQVTFQEAAQRSPKRQASAGSCFCFAPSAAVEGPPGPESAAPKVIVHTELDIAEAIGLMPAGSTPTAPKARPAWCDADFCRAVSRSQEAACEAWSEARAMRSKGKTPSRQDLAGYFTAVHQIKPLPDTPTKVDPHDLDVSTRPDLVRKPSTEDTRRYPASLLPRPEEHAGPAEGTQGDASTRYSEHVADQLSFARKFGHYKNQMDAPPGHLSDEVSSTTGDDSSHAGRRSMDTEESFQTQDGGLTAFEHRASEPDWTLATRVGNDAASPRKHNSLYQLDSAMMSSSGALPTVEEEKPVKAGKALDATSGEDKLGAAEMAVRRGKNRFIDTGTLQHRRSSELSAPKAGQKKPPLPRPAAA